MNRDEFKSIALEVYARALTAAKPRAHHTWLTVRIVFHQAKRVCRGEDMTGGRGCKAIDLAREAQKIGSDRLTLCALWLVDGQTAHDMSDEIKNRRFKAACDKARRQYEDKARPKP